MSLGTYTVLSVLASSYTELTHLWLLILSILHHVVNVTQNRIHRVFLRDIKGQEGHEILVLNLRM